MESTYILSRYQQLPDSYKQEVEDFIDFLLKKSQKEVSHKSRGGLGIAKGKYNLSEDFDEKLPEFDEYSK
jgi:hypothetical protein